MEFLEDGARRGMGRQGGKGRGGGFLLGGGEAGEFA